MAKTISSEKIIEALPSLDEDSLRDVVQAANAEMQKRKLELAERLDKLNGGK